MRYDDGYAVGDVIRLAARQKHLERQLQQGRLANETTLAYAFGLTVGEYRGLRLVEHSGSSGGYRTIVSRFPTEHASVVALCNTTDANTTTVSHQVAASCSDPSWGRRRNVLRARTRLTSYRSPVRKRSALTG